MQASLEIFMSNPVSLPPFEQLSAAMADLVVGAARSVVAVHTRRTRASGFVWRPGYIVTSDEALPEDEDTEITLPGGTTVAARMAGRDATTDIALLRFEGAEAPQVALDNSTTRAGEFVLAVGSRDGVPLCASGMVSLAGPGWRSLRGGEIDARIELDLRLRPSAEGGVVLNAKGGVIGMSVFGPRRRVLVIPAPTIERVAAQLATHGRMPRGYFGLSLQPVKMNHARVGAMVMGVAEQGPGAAAGLHQGDIIVAVNGEPIRSLQLLLRALGPASVGSVLSLSLQRAGEQVEVQLTVGERPAD
jgi:S1-C subfamily serine protease